MSAEVGARAAADTGPQARAAREPDAARDPDAGTAPDADTGEAPGPATDADTPQDTAEPPAPRRTNGTRWLAGLLGAALLFCGFSGWIHWSARSDRDLAYAQARDDALAAGRAHIATLNSVDAKEIRAELKEWRAATTGPLRDELRRTEKKSARTLAARGTSASARVTDAALTSLDERAGTAALLATVRIRASTRAGTPATDRKRFEAGLERTADGWKLTSLAPVPVGKGTR